MYTVFDDFGSVWCQSESFSCAVAVGDYLLSLGKRVFIESGSPRSAVWYSEKERTVSR